MYLRIFIKYYIIAVHLWYVYLLRAVEPNFDKREVSNYASMTSSSIIFYLSTSSLSFFNFKGFPYCINFWAVLISSVKTF